jgi:hypothetical protein
MQGTRKPPSKGKKIGDRTYKNHLDGYKQMAAITHDVGDDHIGADLVLGRQERPPITDVATTSNSDSSRRRSCSATPG